MSPHDPGEGDGEVLAAARSEAIEHLSSAFAHGAIGLDDFERRVDAAYAATDDERLRSVTHGLATLAALEGGPRTAPVRVHAGDLASPRTVPATPAALAQRPAGALAILGSLQRSGTWRVADGTRALAVLGNVELDLRDVVLAPGVTRLVCRAVLGNVEITVPPDLAVECVGAGVLGSFSSVHRIPAEGTARRAVLRIEGAAVLGNVEVRTMPRGMAKNEGGAEARARGRLPARGH